MSEKEEFQVIGEEEIDDDLTLMLARSKGVPRLGIFNTYSEKKRFVPMSWIEGAERTLKIKVGKNTKEYPMTVVGEGVAELIRTCSDKLSINSLAWRAVHLLGDLLHVPKTARSDADLNLIPDNKKDTLWFIYTPKKGKWRVYPCFASNEAEKAVLAKYMEEGRPWPEPAITIENGEVPATMRNMPFTKELFAANHARWSECLLPIARGLLLGFSDFSHSGDSQLGNALWNVLPHATYRSAESLATVAHAAGPFFTRAIAFLRLAPLLDIAKVELVSDATKAAEERGLKKRERFEMTTGNDRKFKVTRVVEEGNLAGFSLVPDTRLPGEQDRLVTMAESSWDDSVHVCALGGQKDPQYTSASVLAALEMRYWIERVGQCIAGPAASGEDGEGSA